MEVSQVNVKAKIQDKEGSQDKNKANIQGKKSPVNIKAKIQDKESS